MIYRTGYLMNGDDGERYIQIETVLVFYRQKFISSGKHLLFEDNAFIGNVTLSNNKLVVKGLGDLSTHEKKEITSFIRNYKAPAQDNCATEFGFGLQLDDNIIYCEVFIDDGVYSIWFDGIETAKITQDEQLNWIQLQKPLLPALTMNEITGRIEKHYINF